MINERARFRLHHPIGDIPPLVEKAPGVPDHDLARRAIDAYAASPGSISAGPVWEALLNDQQGELIRCLATGDADALAMDMAALGRSEAAQGFFGGANQHRKCSADPNFAELLSVWTHDKLLSLAEALGAVRCELAETGQWGATIRIPAAELLDAIEAKLGLDLSPPGHVGGYLGIAAGPQIMQMRVVEAIYAAHRLKALADRHGLRSVCEIGAGAGLTAYYARLMGIEDYVIIDLPSMNAVQAYMLCGSSIGDSVALLGEETKPTSGVRILPPSAFAELAPGSIDILYNQDSLPEIQSDAAAGYLRDAARLGIGLFLSINQEAHLPTQDGHQHSVAELIASNGRYSLTSRHRHWLRQGYVDELYELDR